MLDETLLARVTVRGCFVTFVGQGDLEGLLGESVRQGDLEGYLGEC